MKKIAVYKGKGAYMAKDVESFLCEFDIEYRRLHEVDIQKGDLKNIDALVIGGGSIFSIVPALSQKGISEVRQFVKEGGCYIGICAGAYIACKEYFDKKGKAYKGIGLSKTLFNRGIGEKKVEVFFHTSDEKISLYYCNGPLIDKVGPNELVIANDKDNKIGIIRAEYGKGLVFLFCAHPEGNLYNGISAKKLGSDLFFRKLLLE